MNLYIPKRGVGNLYFILSEFVNTHEDSDASADDVRLAKYLLAKLATNPPKGKE